MHMDTPRPPSVSQGYDYASNDSTHQARNTVTRQDNQIGSTMGLFQMMIQFLRRRHGLVLAAIAPITFSFQSLIVEVLTETLDSFQVVLMHVPLFMICCFLLVLYAGVRPPKDYTHCLWLLLSGASQSGNICLLALALTNMSVGNAVTIFFTSLVQVVFYSRIILKEPIHLFDIVFTFVAFGGVVFIVRPPFIFGTYDYISGNDVTVQGTLFALLGSSTMAIFHVANRKLSTLGVNSYFSMFSNGSMVVFSSGLFTLILQRWRWPTMHEWLFAALAGVAYVCSHCALFYALKVETATLVTVIVTTEIVYAFVWQIVFLHQVPFWTSYVGTVLIIVACIGVTLKNKPPPPPPPPLPSEPPQSNPTVVPSSVQQSCT